MLNLIKSSFKDTIIYSLGNIAVKFVGLILIPLYTDPRYFSVDDFGVLGILEICALVLTALMASALPQSLVRWYWDEKYKDNQKGIFFMSFSTQVIVSCVLCIALIPLSETFSSIIFASRDLGKVLEYIIIASALQAINNILNTLMRLQSKSVLYTISNLLKLTVVLGLTLYAIINKGMGLKGIYLAQAVGNGIIILFLSGYALRNSRIYFNFRIFSSMSAYGFPLFLANISAVTLTVIDRFSLNSMSVLKSVALYTLAFKLASVLKLVLADSIKLAVGPMMVKRMYAPDNKRFFSKVMLYSSFAIMFAIVGLSAFSYETIKVLADQAEFQGAVSIVPVLALSVFFINLKEVTVYGLHIAKKTGIIGMIVIATSLISLSLNILLIPIWDLKGAAVATMMTQLIYWLLCYYFSQRSFYVPYEIWKIILLVFVGMTLSIICQVFNEFNVIFRLILKTICIASFPFILYVFKFYENIELQYIKGFFNKWFDLRRFRENFNSLKSMSDDI